MTWERQDQGFRDLCRDFGLCLNWLIRDGGYEESPAIAWRSRAPDLSKPELENLYSLCREWVKNGEYQDFRDLARGFAVSTELQRHLVKQVGRMKACLILTNR